MTSSYKETQSETERKLEDMVQVRRQGVYRECADLDRPQRLPQRPRCTGMIQTARPVQHELVKCGRDLGRRRVSHQPHGPDDRTKSGELHCKCEMDHLVRILFIPDGHMTSGQVRRFGVLRVALNDSLNCEYSVAESKRRLKWFLLV